jgi:ketosteroid isomerase-like protein
MRELFKDGGFPIKGVDRDAKGNEEARWEVVTIEKKSLDDRLVPPSRRLQETGHGRDQAAVRRCDERGAVTGGPVRLHAACHRMMAVGRAAIGTPTTPCIDRTFRGA